MATKNTGKGWLLASPLVLILSFFLLIPVFAIVMVSFWGSTEYSYYPAFQFDNYQFLLTSPVTLSVYLKTFMFAAITWFMCLVIGFTVAYYLAFHIRSLPIQILPVSYTHLTLPTTPYV